MTVFQTDVSVCAMRKGVVRERPPSLYADDALSTFALTIAESGDDSSASRRSSQAFGGLVGEQRRPSRRRYGSGRRCRFDQLVVHVNTFVASSTVTSTPA